MNYVVFSMVHRTFVLHADIYEGDGGSYNLLDTQ